MSRTNPSEALERLAMTLNYPRREAISINELSEKTNLSWATTRKYVQLLETLGRIAPKITVDENGVTPQEMGENLDDIRDQEDIQLIVYLFTHANIEGSPTAPLDIEDHNDVLAQYEETIQELAQLGWIKRNEETIQLTPEGISIAGPAYSRIRNKDIKMRPENPSVEVSEWGKPGHDANILIDDPTDRGSQIKYSNSANAEANWEKEYSDDDFQTTAGVSS